ncbi:MAG TPA: VOC family protein [Solirubrobacteraceae bacterium]|jgi:hypothetical protein|nr:VOC family protein [Solirubrobacteraceae bacterium]
MALTHAPGRFSWVELAAADGEAAKRFYTALLGWRYADNEVGEDMVYSMCTLADGRGPIGALYQSTQGPPHWNSYVTVEQVDAVAARAGELGGIVIGEPFDVMTAGRMAVVQDPEGAVVCLWEPRDHPGAAVVNDPGAFCWNELACRDAAVAQVFYGGLFGWTLDGDPADYAVILEGGHMNGGLRVQGPGEPPPSWLVYFTTTDVAESTAHALELGAQTFVAPTAMERGTFSVLADPQGAAFGLFRPLG